MHALTNLYLRNERVFSRFSCFSKKTLLLPNGCTGVLSPQPISFFTFCRVFAFTVSAETGAGELAFRILEFTVSAETGAKDIVFRILEFTVSAETGAKNIVPRILELNVSAETGAKAVVNA